MSADTKIVDLALEYLREGLSILPIGGLDEKNEHRHKSPAIRWGHLKDERRATEEEVRAWYSGDRPALGVGIICGGISGNLAVLDFERTDLYVAWAEICESDDIDVTEYPTVRTPRGYHVYVRLQKPEQGRVLARVPLDPSEDEEDKKEVEKGKKKDAKKTIIEVRGEGNYVCAPGTPAACHAKAQRGWEATGGPFAWEAPVVPDEIWQALIRAARAFDEAPVDKDYVTGISSISAHDRRPGTDFCRRGSIAEFGALLERHDWTLVRDYGTGRQIWRRPGKTGRGGSATLGAVATDLGIGFYVFSTNAEPFEANRCYSYFSARALLEFGGDFRRCASRCRIEGYGTPTPAELREEVAGYIRHWKDAKAREELQRGVVEAMLTNSPVFKSTWNRKRAKDFGEESDRYTRSLLYQAIRYLGTPAESGLLRGVGLVRLWRERHHEDPARAEDVDYMARQAASMLELVDRSEIEAQAEFESREAGNTREQNIAWLSSSFEFAMAAFVQSRSVSEEATLWIELETGQRIKLGPSDTWDSPTRFERALRGWADPETGQGIPGWRGCLPDRIHARVSWRTVVTVLYAIRDVEGIDDTTSIAIVRWCYEFADAYAAWVESDDSEDWKRSALAGSPFVLEGRLWISLDRLLAYVQTAKSERNMSRRTLIDHLKSAKFEKVDKNITAEDDGRRKKRSFWTIPCDRLPLQDEEKTLIYGAK